MRLAFAGTLALALSFGSAAHAADLRWTFTKQPAEVLACPPVRKKPTTCCA